MAERIVATGKSNVTQVDVNAAQLRQMAKRMVEAATLLEGGWKG
jgi:hypothetical protein